MKKKITDTIRLNWLIKNGYTPAIWRPVTYAEPMTPSGYVWVGRGTRKEIDIAILRKDGSKLIG